VIAGEEVTLSMTLTLISKYPKKEFTLFFDVVFMGLARANGTERQSPID